MGRKPEILPERPDQVAGAVTGNFTERIQRYVFCHVVVQIARQLSQGIRRLWLLNHRLPGQLMHQV